MINTNYYFSLDIHREREDSTDCRSQAPSEIDRGGELDLDVKGEGMGDMDAGVIGDKGDDIDAGDKGELHDVSPDIKHRTWS